MCFLKKLYIGRILLTINKSEQLYIIADLLQKFHSDIRTQGIVFGQTLPVENEGGTEQFPPVGDTVGNVAIDAHVIDISVSVSHPHRHES